MTNLPDVIALGETMRSVVTVAGLSGEPPTELVTHGGAESNTCVALARLGFGAAWVSRLGTDDAGDQVLEALRACGVDLRWVRRDPKRPTGWMFRETSGAPPVYERAGSAASALEPSDLEGVPVEQASAVLVTGITAMLGQGPQRAVRSGDWKLLIDVDRALLFNLRTDIGERESLIGQRTDIAQRLRRLLTAWEQDVDAEAKRTATGDHD